MKVVTTLIKVLCIRTRELGCLGVLSMLNILGKATCVIPWQQKYREKFNFYELICLNVFLPNADSQDLPDKILNYIFKCSHCILILQGLTRSSTFCESNESPYFSHYNPKILASNHYTLEVIPENEPISSIPILIFLCIFIIASSLVSQPYVWLRKANKKQPCGKIAQNVS